MKHSYQYGSIALILVFGLSLISLKNMQFTAFYKTHPCIQKQTQKLANHIAANDIIVYGRANNPKQWQYFTTLKKNANSTELLALTNHPNSTVRCYAYTLLKNKKYEGIFEIVKSHLKDTSKVTIDHGCLLEKVQVSDYMLFRAASFSFASLSKPQQETIDSIVLFDDAIHNDYKKNLLATRTPKPTHYSKIRALSLKGYPSALIGLAKFRKATDVYLIKNSLQSSNFEQRISGLSATINFPSPELYPLIIDLYNEQSTPDKQFNPIMLRCLYASLAQYTNEQTRQLFTNRIGQFTSTNHQHRELIWLALTKYPHPQFNGLIAALSLSKQEQSALQNRWFFELQAGVP